MKQESDRQHLGIVSPRLNKMLAEAALQERATKGPLWPAIECADLRCFNQAAEGWYFCSRECRDEFLKEWLDEVDGSE